MNVEAFASICELFNLCHIEYHIIDYPPCRTSAESATTRANAGFPEAIGAK
jgi:hypothetical protein